MTEDAFARFVTCILKLTSINLSWDILCVITDPITFRAEQWLKLRVDMSPEGWLGFDCFWHQGRICVRHLVITEVIVFFPPDVDRLTFLRNSD